MISNYNVILTDRKDHKVGDIFHVSDKDYHSFWRFDGLEIKSISYNFSVNLHFDLYEWEANKFDEERMRCISKNKFKPTIYKL